MTLPFCRNFPNGGISPFHNLSWSYNLFFCLYFLFHKQCLLIASPIFCQSLKAQVYLWYVAIYVLCTSLQRWLWHLLHALSWVFLCKCHKAPDYKGGGFLGELHLLPTFIGYVASSSLMKSSLAPGFKYWTGTYIYWIIAKLGVFICLFPVARKDFKSFCSSGEIENRIYFWFSFESSRWISGNLL